LIQRPTITIGDLQTGYDVVENLSLTDRRKAPTDQPLIVQQLTSVPPIRADATMTDVFELFRLNPRNTFFPVVNALNQPLGIVREADIKQFVYSQYGKDLLKNKSLRSLLPDLVVRCPMADVNVPAEKILDLFSVGREDEGLLIVQDLRYVGFLSASALLKIIHEKSLRAARDQNPLTRLPGNFVIYEYLSHAVCDHQSNYTLAYIDFDYFKPFNDAYGFRKGDRAITLFAELLKKELLREGVFLGHIGGDDFFIGFRNAEFDEVLADVRATVGRFRADMEGFYEPEDRQRGFLRARDRDGNERDFPLLNASAALFVLPRNSQRLSVDDISQAIADLKKLAKHSADRVSAASLRGAATVLQQPPTIYIDPAHNPALVKYNAGSDRRRSTAAQKLPLGQFFDTNQ
jgi:GGDEF domain-containing protein